MIRDFPAALQSGNRPDWLNEAFALFGYDQHDRRPSCFGGFLSNTLSNLNPYVPSASTIGDLAGGLGTSYWYSEALAYAANTPSRTFGTSFLLNANKSSVFRGFLSRSARAGAAGFWFSVDIAELQALWTEYWDSKAGNCQ